MDKNGCRIISIEASELYKSILENGKDMGLKLPQKSTKPDKQSLHKDPYYKKFKNVLDYSMDALELENVYRKKHSKSFSFKDVFDNEYTLAVINVKFTKAFYGDKNSPERDKNLKELRAYFYENGFNCDGVHYVRYKRSSGSSREGKCLFIDEKLYSSMAKWGECGLKNNGDTASWEAYKSLSLSSVKGFVKIPLDGILIVPDYKSQFSEECVSVEEKDGKLFSTKKRVDICNDIWDGESLLDESIFEKEYSDRHMLLLRNKFFKSCAFRTKLQKWFQDKKINSVDDLKARGFITLANEIDQIVMVTTPNSLKFLKFMSGGLTESNLQKWTECVDDNFGVVKYDKRTRYFDGNMVQTSYQFINSIGLNELQAKQLLQSSIDYISLLRNDPDFMRYHFSKAYKKEDDGEKDDIAEGLVERSEVIFRLMNVNSQFKDTKLYSEFTNDVVEALKTKLRNGKILLSGKNATLFGNGPELLLALSGDFDIHNKEAQSTVLNKSEVACFGFENGKKLVCARSPHITMGNLYCVTNNTSGDIWQYFDLGKNVVCVNAIEENIQQRLNGCDYDSDSMLMTDNELVADVAWQQADKFLVPVCDIKPKKKENQCLHELDYAISKNKIGEIVNLSQKLNSILWNKINTGDVTQEEIDKIYSDICILAVLSGIEIDKAKRNYNGVDATVELDLLSKKYKCEKPLFFKLIDEQKTNKRIKNKKKIVKEDQPNEAQEDKYCFYDSPMEHVYKVASAVDFRQGKEKRKKYIKIIDIIKKPIDIVSTAYKRSEKIVTDCFKPYQKEMTSLRTEQRLSDKEEREILEKRIAELKCIKREEISRICKDEADLYLVLKRFDKGDEKSWYVYEQVFGLELFENMLKCSKEKMQIVVESSSGEYDLHGKKYTKR